VDLRAKTVPDPVQGVVADGPKLLARGVSPRACRQLPSIVPRASHENWPGAQPIIVVLGLQVGDRCSGDLSRGHVGDREQKKICSALQSG